MQHRYRLDRSKSKYTDAYEKCRAGKVEAIEHYAGGKLFARSLLDKPFRYVRTRQ